MSTRNTTPPTLSRDDTDAADPTPPKSKDRLGCITRPGSPPPETVEEIGKSLMTRIPVKRFGIPDEVARAVAFLASDDASDGPARSRSTVAGREPVTLKGSSYINAHPSVLQRFRAPPAKPTVSNIGNRPKPVRLTEFAERQLWNISRNFHGSIRAWRPENFTSLCTTSLVQTLSCSMANEAPPQTDELVRAFAVVYVDFGRACRDCPGYKSLELDGLRGPVDDRSPQ